MSCVLAPELTEGPFYLSGDPTRKDIREGHPGTPLTLRATVLDASTCKPIKNARVDIWHCDAGGVYSGTATQNTANDRFLRGIQSTDARGVATFVTIYPGWCSGRTVHIHARVFLGGNTIHTGQFFFPEQVTDVVHARMPYASRGTRDTLNASDSIYRNGGSRSLLKLVRSGSSYVATIAVGVQRS